MKHSRLSIGPQATFLLLALMIAFSPIVVEAQPLPLDGVGSKSSDATSIEQLLSDETPASLMPSGTMPPTMTISQTLSDEAQRNTIAFDGLAFLTGSLGADSFFPPGKVADFWGFQYLRDNDPSQMGHNPLFLTSAAFNMWNVLTADQRAQLKALANRQVRSINDYADKRFVLMKAFRRLLEGDVPVGSPGLDENAVKAYSTELYRLDGQMSYDRAQVMGGILGSLTTTQTAYLNNNMVGKGMLDWPAVSEPPDMQGLDRDVKEALMTYAGDMYSWYAGSVEADVYFCPERQGTYFGSFYLKDTPVMSTGGSIDPNLTATAGITFLLTLTPTQAALVTSLVDIQKPALYEIVDRRRDISTQLRRFIAGESVSSTTVLSQAERYGELDGEIVYNIATNLAKVNQTLTSAQMADLAALRKKMLGDFDLIPEPYAYRYSDRIPMPTITNTDFLFLPGWQVKVYLPLVMSAKSGSGSSALMKLPDTGQVTDYTSTFGEDSDYTINPPAYTDNGNGTVTDQVTGLVWQQTDGGEMTWSSAVTYCQNLELAGYADWQLPSGHELFGILDHDHNPALNTAAFPVTSAEYWWTANEQVGDSTKAWVVNAGGGIGAHPKSETISAGGTKRFHARCVRNVPASVTSHFTANGNGTVTDDNTGLVWQQDEVTPTVTWEAALTTCENLSLGNRTDWRLPNIKELQSISDDTRSNPSLDTAYFPGVQAARYWSSTTLFGHASSAWFVDFTSGLASYNDKAGQLPVRCVRSD
jgi:hypothetical protein